MFRSTSAMPLMPAPPIPTKWICWYFLNIRVPRVLGNIEEDADRAHGHDERRAAEGDERQRQPLGRQRAGDHPEVDERLAGKQGGQPQGQERPKGARAPKPDANAPPDQETEQADHGDRPEQAELLAEDGEDAVRGGLRRGIAGMFGSP